MLGYGVTSLVNVPHEQRLHLYRSWGLIDNKAEIVSISISAVAQENSGFRTSTAFERVYPLGPLVDEMVASGDLEGRLDHAATLIAGAVAHAR